MSGSSASGGCSHVYLLYDPEMCGQDGNLGKSDLKDEVFPNPGSVLTGNWASGFFTVNKSDFSTVEIALRLVTSALIDSVQLSLLNCPAREIGTPNISLYGTQQNPFATRNIPSVNTVAVTQLGSTTVAGDTSCPVQNISIAVTKQPADYQHYFLVFNYETNPNLIWLFLGEIQFFGHVKVHPTPILKHKQSEAAATGALVGSVIPVTILALSISVAILVTICMYQLKRRKKPGNITAQEADYDWRATALEMKTNTAYGELQTRATAIEVEPNTAYKRVHTRASGPAEV